MNYAEKCVSSVPKPTLNRLPGYLSYLLSAQKKENKTISSAVIADDLGLNQVQVRKDLSMISSGGKPKTGYVVDDLVHELKDFLGYDNVRDAILIGAGQLGKTLLSYNGFKDYGLNIVAAFDNNEAVIGTLAGGKKIFPMSKMSDLCKRLNVHIGIITVPAAYAQEICDTLISCGILAVWNFAPVHLVAPPPVILQNENMAASLAVLSARLEEQLNKGNNTTL